MVLCKYLLIKSFSDFFIFFIFRKLKLLNEAEKIVTNTIICTVCGGAGHISTDCKFRKKPDGTYAELNSGGSFINNGNRQEQQKFDCEVS